jgi:pimeloyl-ACP methyl ester carboxylesterase
VIIDGACDGVVGKDKKIILAGHDMGGIIAWVVALYYPNLVEKLVIINAPHPTICAREVQSNPIQRASTYYLQAYDVIPTRWRR